MDIYLRQKAVNPRVVIETTDTSLISSYVRGDLGFAFVPASVVSKSPELKRDCIKVTWGKMEGHVVVSWNDKLYKTSTHLLFREFIKDYFSSKYRV
jgi:DNA-binding transcriptional LysR family regulator